MSLGHRITALLTALSREQIRAMAPFERQRLADQALRVLQACMPEQERTSLRREVVEPKTGVLRALKDGERAP
jgi:hypothetical protein